MRDIEFGPQAEDEFARAAFRYEGRAPGLGDRFIYEVMLATDKIQRSPALFAPLHGPFRHYVMGSFPFSLIYAYDDETVHIISVHNHNRHPDHWKDRI